jgi:hypothetical protein
MHSPPPLPPPPFPPPSLPHPGCGFSDSCNWPFIVCTSIISFFLMSIVVIVVSRDIYRYVFLARTISSNTTRMNQSDSVDRNSIPHLVLQQCAGEMILLYSQSSTHQRPPSNPEDAPPANETALPTPPINEDLVREEECIICWDSRRYGTFLPCGHFICYLSCAKKIRTCPMCRTPIQSLVRTYT